VLSISKNNSKKREREKIIYYQHYQNVNILFWLSNLYTKSNIVVWAVYKIL